MASFSTRPFRDEEASAAAAASCARINAQNKKNPGGLAPTGVKTFSDEAKDYAEKMRSSFSSIFTSFDFVATAISLIRSVRAVSSILRSPNDSSLSPFSR